MHSTADHKACAQSFADFANDGRTTYRGALVAVECRDLTHVVTFDPGTGGGHVWRVDYSARRVRLQYRRLTPKHVRVITLDGANWRERRDAAKSLTVS